MDEIFNMSQDNLNEEDLADNASIYHNGNPINSLNCQKENDFGLLFESESINGTSLYEENGYNGNFNFMSSDDRSVNEKLNGLMDGKWIEKPSSYGVMGMNFSSYMNTSDDR